MADTKTVAIPPIDKRELAVTIVGDTSLLCHRMSPEIRQEILDKQMGKPVGGKKPKDPEACFEAAKYMANEGWYGFPVDGIKDACVSACRDLPNIAMTQARGRFFIVAQGREQGTGQDLVMITGEPNIRQDKVKLGGRTLNIRFRAEFLDWTSTFTVRYNAGAITEEAIVHLINQAGFSVGIGDWRPQCNGTHGMFHVGPD